MTIQQEPDYRRFLKDIRAGLGHLQALHTPLFSRAESIAANPPLQSVAALVDRVGGSCRGAALVSSAGAAELAVTDGHDPAGWVPWFEAPMRALSLSGIEGVIDALALHLDGSWSRRPVQLVMEARSDPLDSGSDGRLRRPRLDESNLIAGWLSAFLAETGQQPPDDPRAAAAALIAGNGLRLWEVANAPVAMAAVVARTARAARVSLIYTPVGHRHRGYGLSCVSATTREVSAGERRTCCLHVLADQDGLVRLYCRAGYRVVGRRVDLVRAG